MNKNGNLSQLLAVSKKTSDGINIGVIGEFGTGKSTYIQSELDLYNKGSNTSSKIINLSLMNSTFEKKIDLINTIKPEDNTSNLHRKVEVELLNKLITNIKYNLIDRELNPSLFQMYSRKDNQNKVSAILFVMSISLITGYILYVSTQSSNVVNILSFTQRQEVWALKILFLFLSLTLLVVATYHFISNNSVSIKKLGFQVANIELSLNDDDSIANLNLYEEYFLYLIEKHKETNRDVKTFIFVFEDIDRVCESFLLGFLREINIFLNNHLECDTKVIFVFAIRNRLFEKLSYKKQETRALIKQEKFFTSTIIMKPFGEVYKKEIYNDIQLLDSSSNLCIDFQKSFFNEVTERDEKHREVISYTYQRSIMKLASCNLEYDLDFRVYMKMVKIIYEECENYHEYLLNNLDDLEDNFETMVLACILRLNIKNAYEFIEFYSEYVRQDLRRGTNYISEMEASQLTRIIFHKIESRYPKVIGEANMLISERERRLCEVFIQLDYAMNSSYLENIIFSEVLGIDLHQRYFIDIENNFKVYYHYPLNHEGIKKFLGESDNYFNILICRPNKYLMKHNLKAIKTLGIPHDKLKSLEKSWIELCYINNEIDDIVKQFCEKVDITIELIDRHFEDLKIMSIICNLPHVKEQFIKLLESECIDKLKKVSKVYLYHNFKHQLDKEVIDIFMKEEWFQKEIIENYSEKESLPDYLVDFSEKFTEYSSNKEFLNKLQAAKVKQIVYRFNNDTHKGLQIEYKYVETIQRLSVFNQNAVNKNTVVGPLQERIEYDYNKLVKTNDDKRTQIKTKINKLAKNM